MINACISHVIITLIRYFLIPKSRDLVSHNPGISGLKNGPGSRDPGIRDPGIAIPIGDVANFLVTSWRLPRNICYGEVTGKLVPVEFELYVTSTSCLVQRCVSDETPVTRPHSRLQQRHSTVKLSINPNFCPVYRLLPNYVLKWSLFSTICIKAMLAEYPSMPTEMRKILQSPGPTLCECYFMPHN